MLNSSCSCSCSCRLFFIALKSYPLILEGLKNGETVPDLGCCFGQELRQLAADGAPFTNMYALDLHGELWELDYDFSCDEETMKAQSIQADVFVEKSRLNELTGKIYAFIIDQFLYLFSRDDHIGAFKVMVSMSKARVDDNLVPIT